MTNSLYYNIVITGFGCISAAGNNVEQFSQTIFSEPKNDSNTITPITRFDTSNITTKIAAEVKNYCPQEHFNKTQLKQLDRFSQFALLATDEAILSADLHLSPTTAARTCVIYGTSIGGQETIEQAYQQYYGQNQKRPHPFTVPKLLPSSASSQISMKYGITGPSFATSSACASSGHAIAMAVLMLRTGMVNVAIVGGSEACITAGNFQAWEGLRVLSNDTCRPFSANRSGLVIGEGAGSLILETQQHAQQRNAKIYAQLVGVGMSSDAHNIVQPLAQGAQQAMQAALNDANLSAEKIDYINAHGSGTLQNDMSETQAIHHTFKQHAQQLVISSTKAVHGHVLGAGAAIESIATILALQKQCLPATHNYQQVDHQCDLNYLTDGVVNRNINYGMSNSFAFGGQNCSLIYTRST
ncbi:MAG: beta-ACP synthase [Gammaproteobacteria bacterium]|nr:MAG: beta-ACP synthase [Gammaproteobacteria bacterium]